MNVEDLKSTWEQLGADDPLWAVLTDPTRKGNRWAVDEFMATGRQWIDRISAQLDSLGLRLGTHVLDFGCGVGRLSLALAERVDRVTGIDIAESMVERAREVNRYPDRVDFHHYDGRLLPFDDASFDSVVSIIVIQHAPPPVQIAALVELQRVLRPGGVMVVQIPAGPVLPDPLPDDAMRAEIAAVDVPAAVTAGARVPVRVRLTNRGTLTWPLNRGIRLGNHWVSDRAESTDDGRQELPGPVPPGGSTVVDLMVTAPAEAGEYTLEIDLVQEGVTWWEQAGSEVLRAPVTVRPAAPAPLSAAEEESAAPARMSMFGMPVELVRGVLEHCGCELVAALPDDLAGDEWRSYTYVVRKG